MVGEGDPWTLVLVAKFPPCCCQRLSSILPFPLSTVDGCTGDGDGEGEGDLPSLTSSATVDPAADPPTMSTSERRRDIICGGA